jgi:RNA polymerase sigma-70 factor (ECF subfamily)
MIKVEGAAATGLAQSPDERELSNLMRQAQDGDSESYRRLLVRIKEMVSLYVGNSFRRFHKSSQEAQEDVLQDILLAIHQKRATYDPQQYFLPWMYAIARYKIIDHFRRQKNFKTIALDEELENIEALMSIEVEAGTEQDLTQLLETLPAKQKEILMLVKLDGLSMEEAAKKTGYSVSDIKVSVHRAIKTLQKKIQESAP